VFYNYDEIYSTLLYAPNAIQEEGDKYDAELNSKM
jgi:hypothetical protein